LQRVPCPGFAHRQRGGRRRMQEPCEGSNGAFGYALDRRFGRGDAQATCDVPEWGFRRVLEVPRETRPGEATPCGGLAARPRSRRRIATPRLIRITGRMCIWCQLV